MNASHPCEGQRQSFLPSKVTATNGGVGKQGMLLWHAGLLLYECDLFRQTGTNASFVHNGVVAVFLKSAHSLPFPISLDLQP